MLQYSSAFDEEVAEFPEDTAAELPGCPDAIQESVLEEPPEAEPEPQLEEESSANQAESARPSAAVVHGPYYYFYQGVQFPLLSNSICVEIIFIICYHCFSKFCKKKQENHRKLDCVF